MSGSLRCFVALAVPDDVRKAVSAHFAGSGTAPAGVRWLGDRALHLTLKFLGEVGEGRLAALRETLAAAVGGIAPFTLALRGCGVFPSVERPRVVWVGAGDGAAAASSLARSVESSLAPLGFAPEGRPFFPHVTVGRIAGRLRGREDLRRLLDAARERHWGDWVVPAVQLVRSELFPEGPIYSILQTNPLAEIPPQGRRRSPD